MDNKNRNTLGITLHPFENFTFRTSGDIYRQSEQDENQRTLAVFAGYETGVFSLGAEYNRQENSKWKDGNNYSGYSVYTTLPVNKKWNVFCRYDKINSEDNDHNVWNSFTGEMIIAGIEYHPVKQLKIAPNYKFVKNFDTQSKDYNSLHTIYLSVLFNW
jgi:phosphate-selective porin